VWHSNKSVTENVKQITKATKTRKAAPKKAAGSARTTKIEIARAARNRRSAACEASAPQKARFPISFPPQLATLHDRPPESAKLRHEVKFDGYRVQARLEDGQARAAHPQGARLDAQVHAGRERSCQARRPERGSSTARSWFLNESGLSDFSALQDSLKHSKKNFVYYVFDLLHSMA